MSDAVVAPPDVGEAQRLEQRIRELDENLEWAESLPRPPSTGDDRRAFEDKLDVWRTERAELLRRRAALVP